MAEYIKREDAIKAIQNVREVMSESMIRHRRVPDCVKSLCEELIDASKKVINRIPPADVVPDVVPNREVERLECLEREVKLLTENTITAKYPHCVLGSYYAVLTKSLEDYEKVISDISSEAKAEVIEEYRQRVNVKMGKHTHLLGKEYVQRILREVAKEMKNEQR